MSNRLLGQAFDIKLQPAALKLLLVALADNADNYGLCWPKTTTLADKCNVSERQIWRNLAALKAMNLIKDTGRRKGKTGRVIVWQILTHMTELNPDTHDSLILTPMTPNPDTHDSLHVTTEPSMNPHRTAHNKTRSAKKKTKVPNCIAHPELIPNLNQDAWCRWTQHRKSLRLKQYTTDLKANQLAELNQDDQMECVKHSIANNYQGLFPDKYKKTESFYEQSERVRRELEADGITIT